MRARMGLRETYRPIETPLSPTAEIGSVAEGLRKIHPFPTFYVADLDAIENGSDPLATADALSFLRPRPEVWLDAGFRSAEDVERALAAPRVSVVLGSESQANTDLLEALAAHPELILSLDFRGDAFMGPPAILSEPALWPRRVIAMTLDKVGARRGPDFERLRAIRDVAGNREIIAAGGVRNAEDLRRLDELGIAGALVATSLHSGELGAAEIASFMGL
ncbi:HisA/HisF-related TIM barrel protein [Pseudomonas sp. R2.Fl]|nr:HisA/HisF-related TIM barrel protein [Pseudomonas sp. R2.Fl]